MPLAIKKNADESYSVVNMETRKVYAKHTTKEKARKQLRLLNAIEHGFVPTGKKSED